MPKNEAGLAVIAGLILATSPALAQSYDEMFRPQYHFTPAQNWMNDPNGLLFADGKFNLFFQYNPSGTTWGNISWGHATGPDLLHWKPEPIALEYQTNKSGQQTQLFFSGSAVADVNNTSGFGTAADPPLVAVYTSFFPNPITQPDGTFIQGGTQAQSIAYSLDQGHSWKQYAGNPVLPLPPAPYRSQYQNFRDPKVFWYAPEKKWVMVASLAALHKVVLFSSQDLKLWRFMSEFGPANATRGVWECPDLFPLAVDGDPTNMQWVLMLGINPGAVAGGSGTQYFVGSFDGKRFTAADAINTYAPIGSTVIQDFEAGSYAAAGWKATGGLAGTGPTTGAIGGQQTVTGYHGTYFADTFEGGSDAPQGTLTSPNFPITKPYINFLVGGGYHPYNPATYGTPNDTETAVNLLINGKVVQSATGAFNEQLAWRSWYVGAYAGANAQIQIVDANSGGWGHLNADYFVASDLPKNEANWVDYGPDFYAASTWNGLAADQRIGVAWMNNWDYGGNIPTSPWRSAMSIPRQFALQTIAGKVRLVQRPITALPNLWSPPIVDRPGNTVLVSGAPDDTLGGASGDTLDISTSFKPGSAHQFGLKLRTGTNGEQTVVGYDAATHEIFLDRFNSGMTGFDPSFPGRYTAPYHAVSGAYIKLRILVDRSSVEVFAGDGEVALTAQIFPSAGSLGLAAFATRGYATLGPIKVWPVNSIWPH